MLDHDVLDRVPDGRLASEWAELVAATPGATVFHTPRFLGCWVRQLGAGVAPRVHTFRRSGRLVGVVAEQLTSAADGAVLRFLGGTEVTDYQGPVAADDDCEEVTAAWIRTLVRDGTWNRALLGGLAEDTCWHELIARHAKDAGLQVAAEGVDDVCPRIDLSGGYEAYLEGLASRQRSEKRRKARKLARELGPAELTEVPPQQTGPALDTFLEMAAGAGGDKGRFFVDARMRGFFEELVDALGGDRTLRLHVLEVAGLPAAMSLSFVSGGEWGLYNTVFDQTLADHAPGLVLVGELIRLAAEEVDVFDFLRGDESYKYRLGARGRTLRCLTLLRR